MQSSLPANLHPVVLIKRTGNSPASRQLRLILLIGLLSLALSACGSTVQLPPTPEPKASPPPPALVKELTADGLPTLVVAEREASITSDLPLLATLWAEASRIVDGRGNEQENDDLVWSGRAAILDRYQLAVFPAPPPRLTLSELADATLTVDGDSATLINGGDRWRFVFQEGRWWLQELIYNSAAN